MRGSFLSERSSIDRVDCVGRDAERAQLRDCLASSRVRAIVLWGPAGVGKTSLAKAAADDHVRRGGFVAWLERVSSRTVAELLVRIHDALGTLAEAESGVAGLVRALHRTLSQKTHPVVVLDGAESCDEVARELAARWQSEHLPGVLLVVTRSRDAIAADHVLDVKPLDALGALECAREHARRHGMAVARFDGDAVTKIVSACAGHPLSIALAMAKLRAETPDEVFAWLRRRSRPTRGRIADAIRDVYEELEKEPRRALMVLASMASLPPIPLTAAVLSHAGLPDALATLTSRGIAWARAGRRPSDPARVWVHDAFLQLARREMRRTGTEATVSALTDEGVTAYGETLVDELGRPRVGQGLVLLQSIRPQLERILERDDANVVWARAALVLNCAFGTALPRRRHNLLTHALELIERGSLLDLRARLARGRAMMQRNEPTRALVDVRAAQRLAAQLEAKVEYAVAAHVEATCLLNAGSIDEARRRLAEVVSLSEQVDAGLAAEGWIVSAYAAHLAGDSKRSEEYAERALAFATASNDPRTTAYASQLRASMHLHAGDTDTSLRLYLGAWFAARRGSHPVLAANSVRGLGCIELGRGNAKRAVRLLKRADAAHRNMDNSRERAATLVYLGLALLASGDATSARDTLAEATHAEITRQHKVLASAIAALAHWSLGAHAEAERVLQDARAGLVAAASLERAVVEAVAATLSSEPPTEALPNDGFEVRVVRQIVARGAAPAVREARARTVSRTGAWFVGYDGSVVTLTHRPALQRLLSTLIAATSKGRGPVPAMDVYRATWPDEYAKPSAALNRVRVAVWTLRRLGLVGLQSSREGYVLSDVEFTDAPAP
jgi:tetratricopeptide (TPR) repeat protein